MNRIDKKFKELKANHKKAFIAFITAGYPNLNITKKLILEFSRIGVDIIELGVPFSDPMADGPTIQESSEAALKKGVNLNSILNLVRNVRRDTPIPICFMSYYNPIFCFGEERFLKQASDCGLDGIIIPDLPLEEGGSFAALANNYKLKTIYFISPTTQPKRRKYIAAITKGFIYYVSLTGVTGPRRVLPSDLRKDVKAIKRITDKPVCVGFGLSRPEQVKQIYRFADGVIVGSAIVQKIKENLGSRALVARVGRFINYLKNV